MFSIFNSTFLKNIDSVSVKDGELNRLARLLKSEIKEKFSSHLKLYILDSGSCRGCELELQALFNPLYDVSSVGIEVVYEIERADILCITGVLSENLYSEVVHVYEKLKEPKRVLTIGDCPLFHAPFQDTYAIRTQGIRSFSPEYHIGGCPPDPRALLRGLLKYLKKI